MILPEEGRPLPTRPQAERLIEPMLARYDENKEVTPYEKTCYCVGPEKVASDAILVAFTKEHGTFDVVREAFTPIKKKIRGQEEKYVALALSPDMSIEKAVPLMREHSEKHDPFRLHPEIEKAWRKHTAAWFKAEKAMRAKVEKLPKVADPECDECKGSGKVKTRRNPLSQWDWYQIGGRWSGAFVDRAQYDPMLDERNWEKCFLCRGGGLRDDELGVSQREKDPAYTCNGCSGFGRSYRPQADHTPKGGDIAYLGGIGTFEPYAFITPDKDWHQKGEMGWFGMSHDEKTDDEWRAEIKAIKAKYKDHVAVLVDCHI